MTEYYTGTQAECQALDDIISVNCSWPLGGTQHWGAVRETTVAGVYAVIAPQGSHGFTKAEMTAGITDVPVTGIEFPNEDDE